MFIGILERIRRNLCAEPGDQPWSKGVGVGDTVGFQDRQEAQRRGTVMRLNDKTVTLDCDGQSWRVACALLHRMIDAAMSSNSIACFKVSSAGAYKPRGSRHATCGA